MFDDVYIAQEPSSPPLSKEVQGLPQDEETFLAIGTLGNNIFPKQEEEEEETEDRKSVV